MKRIKDILYLIGFLFSIGMILFLATAIVQLGTEAAAGSLGIYLKDDFLFTVSGGVGTAITGTLCAFYVKKKNYTSCLEAREPFRIKKCAYYSPEDLRNTIFDSFVVGDDSRNTKNGSGLGLSISRKIIERHGGSLYYVNDWKDGYKCFRIDLYME